jgi:general stress protein 26
MQSIDELDERFSNPGAMATPWAEVEQILESAQMFWITTVRADGRPHLTPLVAVWADDALYFCTGPDEQKAVNIRGNRQVTLSTGCNRWDEGLDVVVEGEATRVIDEGRLQRLAAEWRKKWNGQWQFEVKDSAFQHAENPREAIVFEVAPRKILSFSKGPRSAATRHRLQQRAST